MANDTVYNAANVFVTLNGIAVEGWADGDFCAVEWNSPQMTHKVGADGAITLNVGVDKSGKATLTVAQGSQASALLDSFKRKQDTGDFTGFSFDVINADSGTTASATKAWISVAPPLNFALEGGNEAWELLLARSEVERKPLPSV